jgi:pSer/pThr/pTyr-binding forkhead associated (FHA) protein
MDKGGNAEQATTIARRLTGLHQTGSGRLALRGAMLYLIVVHGPNVGRCYPLANGEVTFGRQQGNTIVLADDLVSRNHARIVAERGQAILSDLGSTNGTYLNGELLDAPRRLRPGDCVQVGGVAFQVSTTSSAELPYASLPDSKVVRTRWHERGQSNQPVYELRSGRLYRTGWHEYGPSRLPDYELRGTFFYRVIHHERETSRVPDYEIRDRALFRTSWHPLGAHENPDYEIQ